MKFKLLIVLLLISLINLGGLVNAQTGTSPQETVEEVIRNAKNYVREKEIDVSEKFIVKVEYFNNRRNNTIDMSYWVVHWINKKVTKGGGVELRLYSDGSIEERYHK